MHTYIYIRMYVWIQAHYREQWNKTKTLGNHLQKNLLKQGEYKYKILRLVFWRDRKYIFKKQTEDRINKITTYYSFIFPSKLNLFDYWRKPNTVRKKKKEWGFFWPFFIFFDVEPYYQANLYFKSQQQWMVLLNL